MVQCKNRPVKYRTYALRITVSEHFYVCVDRSGHHYKPFNNERCQFS